LQLEVRRA